MPKSIIRKPITSLFFLCLLVCFAPAKGQINLFYNETPVAIPSGAFSYYVDTSIIRTTEQYQHIQQQMRPMLANDVNLTYKNAMLWLLLSMDSIKMLPSLHYLMVRNPHVNHLGCWIFKGDSLVQGFRPTGDHYPFASRTIIHPDFVFPIEKKDTGHYSVLLLIDKRNEQLNIPIHLFTDEGFIAHNQKDDLLAGIITGIGLLLFILNLFLYFKMKERLYVFYGLYVLMAFLYIITDYGLSFKYLYPGFYQIADFTRPLATSFAAPLYALFSIQLLDVKKQMPVQYKWAVRYLILYLVILISGMTLMPSNGTLRIILLLLMQIFQNINSLLTLVLAIIGVRKKVPYSGYMIASSCILLVSFLLYMNFLSGYIGDNLFSRNMMNLGFTFEICILAFVLTLRFRDYKEKSEKLLRQVNTQQEQIFKNLSDYQEKEMLRVSSLLHDSIGASLSAIRLNLESLKYNENGSFNSLQNSVQQVNDLANEVRQLSHGLSPILLQKNGLVKSLEIAVEAVNRSNRIEIQFESIGSLQRVSFRYEMLVYNVVQELIQNIIKHSAATEAIVQLMLENELVSIFVEDNGRGFDDGMVSDGLGFLQIKQLVKFVNGSIQIKTLTGSGCQVSIEFPVLPDERTHKDPYS